MGFVGWARSSRRWFAVALASSLVTVQVVAGGVAPAGAATGSERITVTPSEQVEDGVPVTVTGSGFGPHVEVGIGECDYVGLFPYDDFSYCGGPESGALTDANGSFTTTITPVRGFRGQSGIDVDCFRGCDIVAIELDDPNPYIVAWANFLFGPLPAPAGTISFRRAGFVTEGNSGQKPVLVEVRHEPPSNQTVSVQWTTKLTPGAPTERQADPGTDYVPASGTVTFAPGESRKNISITTKGDGKIEQDEGIVVYFSHPVNAPLDGHYAVGVIRNDDGYVFGGKGTIVEGNSGTVTLSVPVLLTVVPSAPVTVHWQAISVSGRAGFADPANDFVVASGTATFAAGSFTTTVPITVKGDTRVEGDELFVVKLSNPSSGQVAYGPYYGGIGFGVIVDDD